MKKQGIVISKTKAKIGAAFVGVLILLLIWFNFFLPTGSKNTLSSNQTTQPNTNSPLYKELSAIYNKLPTQSGKANFLKQSNNLTKKVDSELVDLDSQIITCSGNVDGLMSNSPSTGGSCVGGVTSLSNTKGMYLSGQCCGALMDTKARHENLKKLQAYKDMPDIILDPFHTPITLAKKWIDYDNSTTLSPDEQKVFDEAYTISKEKPCCCKCWHYYTNEGIAKKMIKDGTFNAKQIAAYWDASDICGV